MNRFLQSGTPHRLAVAALFAAIFAVHLLYIFVVQLPEREVRLRGKKIVFQGLRLYDDEDQYLLIAHHLYQSGRLSLDGQHPTGQRVPLYPLALAGTFALSAGLTPTLGLNCLLAALTALLAYALARLFWSPGVGLAAMAAVGLSPHTFNWFLWIQAEALLSVLILAFLIAFLQLLRTGHGLYALVCGLLAGLASLTRPETVLLAPLYLAVLIHYCVNRRRPWLRPGLVLVLGTALVLTPWLCRNYAVLGSPSLSTLGGFTFAGAHNTIAGKHPGSWYAFMAYAEPGELAEAEKLSEPAQDRYLWQRGIKWLRDQTLKDLIVLELHKLHRTFKPSFRFWGKEFGPDILHFIIIVPFTLLFLFGVTAGLARQVRDRDPDRRHQFLALWLVFLIPLAVTLIFWGAIRFRVPYEPVAFTLGVGCLAEMLTAGKKSGTREKAPVN